MNIDINKNRDYYAQLSQEDLCNCVYCKNYYKQVKYEYPKVDTYLKSLGIDIGKPFETSPLEPENEYLTYCSCQYIAFGDCEDDYHYKIGNIEFRKATSYPDTNIKDKHFVLEFSPITLKANF